MKTWLIIIGSVLFVVIFVLIVSYLSSMFILSSASKYQDEMNNKYLSKIKKLLPNKNCAECGCDTCEEYANELLQKRCSRTCPYCLDFEKIDEVIKDFDKDIEDIKIQKEKVDKENKNIEFLWKKKKD